jgi:hypothetical protein
MLRYKRGRVKAGGEGLKEGRARWETFEMNAFESVFDFSKYLCYLKLITLCSKSFKRSQLKFN